MTPNNTRLRNEFLLRFAFSEGSILHNVVGTDIATIFNFFLTKQSEEQAELVRKVEMLKKVSNNSVYVEAEDGMLVQVDSYNMALDDVLSLITPPDDTPEGFYLKTNEGEIRFTK